MRGPVKRVHEVRCCSYIRHDGERIINIPSVYRLAQGFLRLKTWTLNKAHSSVTRWKPNAMACSHFWASSYWIIPWVPEVFSRVRRGASFRRPQAVETSGEAARKNFSRRSLFKTWPEPETALEKPLAPILLSHVDNRYKQSLLRTMLYRAYLFVGYTSQTNVTDWRQHSRV